MITLPAGFDIATLVADFVSLVLPFVGVAALFLAYRVISRSLGGVRG